MEVVKSISLPCNRFAIEAFGTKNRTAFNSVSSPVFTVLSNAICTAKEEFYLADC